jgi:SAM-dependent methyltransferase
MELFSPLFDVKGLDQDSQMVRTARENGFEALQASAMSLPFDDGSFDVVYCSFTLLWVDDPQRAVQEMARVARRHVVCLAEPDYGGRIVVPKEVADLDQYLVRSMMDEGADPYIGRRLGALMENAGLRADVGVHSGTWTVGRLRNEAASEWDSIEDAARPMIGRKALDRARKAWNDATSDGSLLFYNPVFYAIGNK